MVAYCIILLQYTAGDVENKPAVTSEADVVSIELDSTKDYIVLACRENSEREKLRW